MEYVIGCDVGSQGTKAALLSLSGELVGEANAGYEIDYPYPLWAQQPVERWTNALRLAIRALLRTTGVDAGAIRGLALATQVDGVVPVDLSGQPLCPAIIWMDRRATGQANAARSRADPDDIFARTGLNLDATHVAPKIRWLAENEPRLYERAAYFLLPGSYLAFYLTGERAVDYSNASSTMLLDVRTKGWSSEMCGQFGIEMDRLAPVRAATTVLGTLRPRVAEELGLLPGTYVMTGSGDEHAACAGAGVLDPGLVGDIAGTAEPVCMASERLLFDEARLVETHCHADDRLWLIENPGFVSGGSYRWYLELFGHGERCSEEESGGSAYRRFDAEAERVQPGSEGLIFLPCLMGAMAPTWNENARGTWTGFTLSHTRGHFARALLEGTSFAVRDIVDRFSAMGMMPHEIRVMGGGATSALWNQIKADVVGMPVVVPQTTETTALGAGLLALVGLSEYPTLAEAGKEAVRVVERFEPRSAFQEICGEYYALYRETYFALSPIFERMADLKQASREPENSTET
jgi:xylulokinase